MLRKQSISVAMDEDGNPIAPEDAAAAAVAAEGTTPSRKDPMAGTMGGALLARLKAKKMTGGAGKLTLEPLDSPPAPPDAGNTDAGSGSND